MFSSNLYTGLKSTFGIWVVLASTGHLYCWGDFLGPVVDLVHLEICGINSCGEIRSQKMENKQWKEHKHKTHVRIYFPLDHKIGTNRLIFHYIPFNVTIYIYIYMSKHA